MSENTAAAPKKSFFKGVKSEFKKIIWPNKRDVVRGSAASIVISIILGLIIALLDLVIKYGIDLIIN